MVKPRILFILHLHDAIEEITNRSMRKSRTMAQNKPLLLTGTGCSPLRREKSIQGTGRLRGEETVSILPVYHHPIYLHCILQFTEHSFLHTHNLWNRAENISPISQKRIPRFRKVQLHALGLTANNWESLDWNWSFLGLAIFSSYQMTFVWLTRSVDVWL